MPLNERCIFDSEVICMKKFDLNAWNRLKERFPNVISSDDYSRFQAELTQLKVNFTDLAASLSNYMDIGEAGDEDQDYRFSQLWLKLKSQYPLLFKANKSFNGDSIL